MGEVLYRKYRPRVLTDVVGQPHITTTLSNALKSGRISHAYLFTGPRGVGKTSVARILAYELNQMTYDDASSVLDIIEIDAASNRRIDEIRDLRDKVHIAPTSAKYKVYIIDEVHMLTREAFNALLKTLEEPPAHAIFILATTEIHKLPETIVSRTQRFTFKPVEESEVIAHLKMLAKKEKMPIDDDALQLIAIHGQGSFRDSISLLDQLRSMHGDTISLKDVQYMLGIPPLQVIESLVGALKNGTMKDVADMLAQSSAKGFGAPRIAHALSAHIRSSLINSQPALGEQSLPLLEKLLAVPAAADSERYLEIILLECVLAHGISVPPTTEPPKPKTQPKTEAKKPEPKPQAEPKAVEPEEPEPSPETQEFQEPITDISPELWQQVLQAIKTSHNTLYGVARMADVRIEGSELVLAFAFAFHEKRVKEPKNYQIIQHTLHKVAGGPVTVRTIIDKKATPAPAATTTNPTQPPQSDTLEAITNIFGGGEVIED